MNRKVEIVEKKLPISDKEIEATMDFGAILERSRIETVNKKVTSNLTKKLLVGLFIMSITSILIWYTSTDNNPSEKVQEAELTVSPPNELQDTDNIANRVDSTTIDEPTVHLNQTEMNNIESKSKPKIEEKEDLVAQVPTEKKIEEIQAGNSQQTVEENQKQAYDYVDAQPLEGMAKMYQYFDENLIYPPQALPDSIEGTVLIRFTITKEGYIDNIFIEKSLGQNFDQEAIRLIENMPVWKPATVNGVPVASRISLPLHFNIKE